MNRLAALLLIALAAPAAWSADYLQAVEFPYYLYPRTLWERELVWLKNIGVQTVEFSLPANFHQLQPGGTLADHSWRLHGIRMSVRRESLRRCSSLVAQSHDDDCRPACSKRWKRVSRQGIGLSRSRSDAALSGWRSKPVSSGMSKW